MSNLVRPAGPRFVISGVVWAVLKDLASWLMESCSPEWLLSANSIATSAARGVSGSKLLKEWGVFWGAGDTLSHWRAG